MQRIHGKRRVVNRYYHRAIPRIAVRSQTLQFAFQKRKLVIPDYIEMAVL
jgi:hypothetical protein